MTRSMELMERALEKKTAAAWARELNITAQVFSMAKRVNRISPALAGNLAIELGEPPERWIAIAALEAEKESPLTERLRAFGEKWRKL
jgi:hypothetical protein